MCVCGHELSQHDDLLGWCTAEGNCPCLQYKTEGEMETVESMKKDQSQDSDQLDLQLADTIEGGSDAQ